MFKHVHYWRLYLIYLLALAQFLFHLRYFRQTSLFADLSSAKAHSKGDAIPANLCLRGLLVEDSPSCSSEAARAASFGHPRQTEGEAQKGPGHL